MRFFFVFFLLCCVVGVFLSVRYLFAFNFYSVSYAKLPGGVVCPANTPSSPHLFLLAKRYPNPHSICLSARNWVSVAEWIKLEAGEGKQERDWEAAREGEGTAAGSQVSCSPNGPMSCHLCKRWRQRDENGKLNKQWGQREREMVERDEKGRHCQWDAVAVISCINFPHWQSIF